MRNKGLYTIDAVLRILFVAIGLISHRPLIAQIPELQAQVREMMQAAAKNKQALARFTWVEEVTISLKGEQKKQEHFQVRLGPDGEPQRTSLDAPSAPSPGEGRHWALKVHVAARKPEELEEYAARMKSLAQQYLPPEKDRLKQAWDRGDITLGAASSSASELQLIIHNYLEPDDSMTLVMDKTQKQLISVEVATWLDAPKDAVNLTVQFGPPSGGLNQISSIVIDGIDKRLNIVIQDSNYQSL